MLACLALGTTALGACTHSDPPPPSSSPPTPSAPTVEPTPTVTATPPAAPPAAPTAKSAEAFVRYFWQVQNYSYATLDSTILTSIAASDCDFCAATVKDISNLKKTKTISRGSAVDLITIAATPGKISTGTIVAVVVSQQPGQLIRTDGSIKNVKGLPKTQGYVGLDWTGHKWLVDDVALNKSGKNS